MSPDEFRLALHTIETLPPEISREAENLTGTIGIDDVLPELIRRSREHLAAEASDDEVEAAVNAMLRSESWSCFFSREDCTAIARAALAAAKIKTAEAVAAEREACAKIAEDFLKSNGVHIEEGKREVFTTRDLERWIRHACRCMAEDIRARGSSS